MLHSKKFRSIVSLNLVHLLFLLPKDAEARRCHYYIDNFGRRRERCSGLIGGGIAGIVLGCVLLLVMIFALSRIMRRRRQSNTTMLPIVNQGYQGPPPGPPPMGQYPPPTQQPYDPGYQGGAFPGNQYQPPSGPPPGEKYDAPNHHGPQIPTPAVTRG